MIQHLGWKRVQSWFQSITECDISHQRILLQVLKNEKNSFFFHWGNFCPTCELDRKLGSDISQQNVRAKLFKGSTRFFLRSSTRPWIIDQEVSNHQTFLNKPLICWQQKRSTRYFSFGLETTIAKSFSYPDIFDNHWTS